MRTWVSFYLLLLLYGSVGNAYMGKLLVVVVVVVALWECRQCVHG